MSFLCNCLLISLYASLQLPIPPSLIYTMSMSRDPSDGALSLLQSTGPHYGTVMNSPETQGRVGTTLRNYLSQLQRSSLTLSPVHTALLSEILSQLVLSPLSETVLPIPSLLDTSRPLSYHIGTGRQLLNHIYGSILTGPTAARHEILFVTCFWAKSQSLNNLSQALLELNRLRQLSRGIAGQQKLRVRICISSLSLFQKLLHTSSNMGYTYPITPSAFRKLGLPSPSELGNLDIVIKSKFFKPASVLHGKYVIVDRKRLYLPSCNVSWEEWGIVDSFLQYHQQIWGSSGSNLQNFPARSEDDILGSQNTESSWIPKPFPAISIQFREVSPVPTIFLPQPHHATFPPIRLLPSFFSKVIATCLSCQVSPAQTRCPPTPQNIFIATLIRQAHKKVFIQTPNLTCPFLLDELYNLLTKQGGDIEMEIVTCRKMMVLEQIVTTGFGGPAYATNEQGRKRRWGATTEACVEELLRRLKHHNNLTSTLKIYYYSPLPAAPATPPGKDDIESMLTAREEMELARQSHVKALVVDDEVAVIGSANGDRASWYTSGEVNVMILDRDFAKSVREGLSKGVGSRKEVVYHAPGEESS
ncbi:hypothetical protein BDZ91DRAFT_708675 [Kalaharituber pfeilii]|nr:hypothetical protein BDZ91DRAFT_708675 [Kalaharituber pfeilii]